MRQSVDKRISSTLIENIDYLITLQGKILRNASLYLRGVVIKEVASGRQKADRIIDASGMIAFPGFVSTHLHTLQVFHRHCPAQQNEPIDRWIRVTTSIAKEMDEEAAYYGALVCFAELMLSGVTTVLDYFYPFCAGRAGTFEATIQAAKDIGIRFTAIRGSMSQSREQGTLYDERVTEDLDEILLHSEKMIRTYHDTSPFSMIRIGLGPCLPFSSAEADFLETAKLARKYGGVILQTHAAESEWEVTYCEEKFGVSPIRLMEKTGFLGLDTSLVQCNFVTDDEIELLGSTKTNVVFTPVCNTRNTSDGNGVMPFTKLKDAGVNISIGTDGPASNDSLNMQTEMRFLRTVSQAKEGLFWHHGEDQARFTYAHPMDVLKTMNLGGARTLNRDDIGSLEAGKAADIAIFDPDAVLTHAGALNKWGAIMSCQPIRPKYLIINGRVVIEDGQIRTINIEELNRRFRKIHKEVIRHAQDKLPWNLSEYAQ